MEYKVKTIIARFQELKKSPDEIGEIDGEIIDANKIETALRSVGVALRDETGQFRELDDVFIELSSKWDSLDVNTQRYIATIAAGSRQQSRFIAMMSDYARTQELVTAANNAMGASTEQFNKTLESLETKLAQLKNAWDTFTTTLLNNELIKGAITFLTNILSFLNKITSTGPSWAQSAEKILLIVAAIKMADKAQAAFRVGLTQTKTIMGGFGAVGRSAFEGIQKSLANIGRVFKKGFWVTDTKKAAAAMTSYSEAVRKSEVSASRYQSLQNRGLATQKTKTIYDSKMVQLENQKAAATRQYASAMGLSNEQAKKELATGALLNSQNAAQAVLEGTLTNEEKRQIIVKGTSLGLSEKEIEQNLKNAASLIVKKGADEASQKTERLGLLTKIKYIAMALFAGKSARQEALAKLGLVPANGAATASQTALNAAIYACPIGWIILGIAALVAAIAGLIYIYNQFTPEKKLEKAKEATEAATKAAEGAKEAYNGLKDGLDGLNDKYEALDALTVGTQEWRDAMIEANIAVSELIDKYPELAQYYEMDSTGVLRIKEGSEQEVNNIKQQYANRQFAAQGAVQLAKANQAQAQLNVDYTNLSDELKDPNKVGRIFGYIGAGLLTTITGPLVSGAIATSIAEAGQQDKKQQEEIIKSVSEGISKGEYLGAIGSTDREKFANWLKDKVPEASQSMIDSMWENKDQLDAFGKQIGKLNMQMEVAYSSVANAAVSMIDASKYTSEQMKQMITAADADLSKQAEKLVNEKYASYGTNEGKWKQNAEFMDYLRQTYGENVRIDWGKIKVGDEEKTTLEASISSFKSNEVTSLVNQWLEKLPSALQKAFPILAKYTTTSEERAQKAIKELYSAKEGGTVSEDTLKILKELKDNNRLEDFWKESGLNEVYTDIKLLEDFIYGEQSGAVTIAENISESLTQVLNRAGIGQNVLDSTQSIKANLALAQKLSVAAAYSGSAEAEQLYTKVLKPIIDAAGDRGEEVYSILNGMDWTSIEQIKNFVSTLKDIGLTSTISEQQLNNFEEQMILVNKAAHKIELDKLAQQFENVKTALDGIGRSFEKNYAISAETYEALYSADSTLALQYMKYGEEYVYIGNNINELVKQVSDIYNLLDENYNYQQRRRELGSALKNDNKVQNYAFMAGYGQLTEENYKNATTERLRKYLEGTQYYYGDLLNEVKIENFNTNTVIRELSENDVKGIVGKLFAIQTDADLKNLAAEETNQIIKNAVQEADKYSESYILNEIAKQRGIATTSKTVIEKQQAQATAKGYTQYLKGEAIINEVDTYLLDKYNQALLDLENNIPGALTKVENLEKEIASEISFNKAIKNLKNLITQINDLVEEYDSATDSILKFQSAKKIAIKFGIELDESSSNEFINNVKKFLNGDNSGLLQILMESASNFSEETRNIIAEAFMNGKELSDSFIDSVDGLRDWLDNLHSIGLGTFETLNFDVQNFTFSTDSLIKSLTNSLGTAAEKWENSFKWLYNIDEYINSLDRSLQRLQFNWENFNTLGETTFNQTQNYYSSMLDNYEYMYNAAYSTAVQARSGINSLFKDMPEEYRGLVGIDSNGQITINQSALNEAQNTWTEEQGEKFTNIVNELVELRDTAYDSEASIKDTLSNIRDIKKKLKESYATMLDKVESAIKEQRKELIDEMSNINSTIKEANSELKEAMSEAISEYRQQRTNEQTEQNLEDSIAKLAYLQSDTSGANAVAILEQQKALEDARQNYEDSLIDQALNSMADANEEAAEQRERQIQIAQAQYDYWVENESRKEADDILREALEAEDFFATDIGQLILKIEGQNKTASEILDLKTTLTQEVNNAKTFLNDAVINRLEQTEENLASILSTFTNFFQPHDETDLVSTFNNQMKQFFGDESQFKGALDNIVSELNGAVGENSTLDDLLQATIARFGENAPETQLVKNLVDTFGKDSTLSEVITSLDGAFNKDSTLEKLLGTEKENLSSVNALLNSLKNLVDKTSDKLDNEEEPPSDQTSTSGLDYDTINQKIYNGEYANPKALELDLRGSDLTEEQKTSLRNTYASINNPVDKPQQITPDGPISNTPTMAGQAASQQTGTPQQTTKGQSPSIIETINEYKSKEKNDEDWKNILQLGNLTKDSRERLSQTKSIIESLGIDMAEADPMEIRKSLLNLEPGENIDDVGGFGKYLYERGINSIYADKLKEIKDNKGDREKGVEILKEIAPGKLANPLIDWGEALGFESKETNGSMYIDYQKEGGLSDYNMSLFLSEGKIECFIPDDRFALESKFKNVFGQEYLRGVYYKKRPNIQYKTGGLADFTGPAWLDGTKAKPELVLNSRDTQNFIQLRDILREFLGNTSTITNNQSNTTTSNTFDIDVNVDSIDSDYDVDELTHRIKTIITDDAMYRNVTLLDN